jgi:hypothetical protein
MYRRIGNPTPTEKAVSVNEIFPILNGFSAQYVLYVFNERGYFTNDFTHLIKIVSLIPPIIFPNRWSFRWQRCF